MPGFIFEIIGAFSVCMEMGRISMVVMVHAGAAVCMPAPVIGFAWVSQGVQGQEQYEKCGDGQLKAFHDNTPNAHSISK